jgi:phage shock protein PspC (stress-responsive transcriptional regulator)
MSDREIVPQDPRGGPPAERPKRAPLRRYPAAGWLGGVVAGIAYELDIPMWVLRLLWFLLFAAYGIGALAYLLLWVFVPKGEVPLDHEYALRDRT